MTRERERWDDRHRANEEPPRPSPFILEVAGHLPRGRCLDVAAGRGGNALFLARRGYRVEAIDFSFVALSRLRAEARARSLDIRPLVADLAGYPLPRERYAVVLCFRYLDRELWPHLERALIPGGALLFETFTEAHREHRPDFPASYCLRPHELLEAFPKLQTALYRELPGDDTASLLAFRPH